MSVDISSSHRLGARGRLGGRRDDADPVIRLEIYGLLVLAFAVTLLLALVSFDGADLRIAARARDGVSNWIGPIGAHIADLFLGGLGLGAFMLDVVLSWLGVTYLIGRRARITRLDVFGWLGILLASAVLFHVTFAPATALDHLPGGLTGEWVGEISASLLSAPGTFILFGVMLVISLIAVTPRSIFDLMHIVGRTAKRSGALVRCGITYGDGAKGEDEDEDASASGGVAPQAPGASAPSRPPARRALVRACG